MAEIDASMISPGVDMSKLGDPSKYDFIPDKSGKYIPVLKNTPIAQRAGEVFKERVIDRPTNPIGAAVRGASDALKGASTVLGSIGPAIGEATADTPEEKQYRHNQLLQKWNKPTQDLGVVPAANVVKSNVGRDATDAEMADATSPSGQTTQAPTPQDAETQRKAILKSIGYDVDSPAFKTMEDNFKKYKAASLADADIQSSVFLQTQDKMQKIEADRAVKAANFNEQTQASIRDYAALNNKFIDMTLNAPTRQETENNYWANKSNKSRVFGLLSLGFGNAQTWANYNHAIDAELDAQVNKMKLFDKGLTNQQTLVGLNRDIAKDENDAFLMAKSSMLEMSEMVLKSIAIKKGTRDAMFNAEKDIDKLRYEREQIQNQLQMSVKSKFLEQQQSANLTPLTNVKDVPESERATFVSDFGKFYSDKESTRKFREEAGSSMEGIRAVQNLLAVADLPVSERANPLSKVSAQAKVNMQSAIGALRIALTGPGVLTEADRKFIIKTIGDPTKVDFLKLEKSKLETLNKLLAQRLSDKAISYGADPEMKGMFGVNRSIKTFSPNAVENK